MQELQELHKNMRMGVAPRQRVCYGNTTMQEMIVNGRAVALTAGVTVHEAARAAGIGIPVLCHRDGLHPSGGCGACTVEDAATGRLLPACATRADAAMRIETASPRALAHRKAALELLLSNHPADCEAPCQMACPARLPVPEMLRLIAAAKWGEAAALAQRHPVSCPAAPCEKACRRKPLGGAVAICAVHRLLAGAPPAPPQPPPAPPPKIPFRSRMTGLADDTLLALAHEKGPRTELADGEAFTREHARTEAARCLQCGCRKAGDCRLRELCADAGAKQSAFAGGHSAIVRERDGRGFAFDSSRCVLCGICVRVAQQAGASIAPAFRGRGFDARIAPPLGRAWHDIPAEVLATCATSCPTGAMSSN